jgi:Protein of unknown function (DUF1552)
MRQPGLGRRALLRGASGAILTLPFLASLERGAQAAAATKRIVFIYLPQNETEAMLPKAGASFSLVGTYLESLEPYASKVTVFQGAKGAHGHQGGHSECLTGWPSPTFDSWAPTKGPSIDQLMADRIGSATPLPSLQLTLQSKQRASSNDGTISWTAAGLPIPPLHDPYLAFMKVFGGAAGGASDAAVARQRALKTSLLDHLMADHANVSKRLDTADRRLLDAHLELLRQQELKLQNTTPFSCTAPADVPPNTKPPDYSEGNWVDKTPQHIGVLVGALRCDATRVASMMFGFSQETNHHKWTGQDLDFHTISHGSNKTEFQHHFVIRQWEFSQVALLAKSLAAVPDPGGSGTLLDSTTIVCLPELGLLTAADESHSREGPKGVGGVIIGDCGGFFKTGHSVDLGGTSYHNLLLTLVHAMGYTDVTSVGAKGTTVLTPLLA